MPTDPTPAARLEQADVDLERLNTTLERLRLERHQLYACIRDVKTLRRNVEIFRTRSDGMKMLAVVVLALPIGCDKASTSTAGPVPLASASAPPAVPADLGESQCRTVAAAYADVESRCLLTVYRGVDVEEVHNAMRKKWITGFHCTDALPAKRSIAFCLEDLRTMPCLDVIDPATKKTKDIKAWDPPSCLNLWGQVER